MTARATITQSDLDRAVKAAVKARMAVLLPRAHCAELFAREPWAGHEVWGNQVEKFEGVG